MMILVTVVFCLGVSAEENTGSCGEDVIWSFDAASGTLTVSGEGNMYDYTYTERPGYEAYMSEIGKVVVEDGVTSIGEYAFYEYEALEYAVIGDSVEHIGRDAFGYTYVTYVDIPISVEYIGPGAFPASDWTIVTLKYQGNEEQWLEVELDLNNYELGYTVINIVSENVYRGACGDDLFWRLDKDTGVFEISGSGDMYNYSLYIMDMPWYGLERYVTKLVVGDNVTRLGKDAFFGFPNMTEVVIGSSVESIGYEAFHNCPVSDVYYRGTPDEWSKIDIEAYNYCLSYATMHYYYGETEGICGDDLRWSFDFDTYTLSIVGTGDMYDYDSSAPAPWLEYILYIKTIKISDTVTSIGDYAFYDIWQAESVELGASVESIGKCAFEECTYLRKISFPPALKSIGEGAFRKCESVDSYITDLEAWCGIELADISSTPMFSGGKLYLNGEELTELYIPDSVTVIKPYAFCCVDGLKTVVMGEGVTEIGHHAFASCPDLAEVKLSGGLRVIGNAVFEDCPSLSAIELPEGLESIGEGVFQLCFELVDINIPDSVRSIGCDVVFDTAYYDDVSNWEDGFLYIGRHLIAIDYVISGAQRVKEGTLTIADEVFYGYDKITELYIPDSVIAIGKNSFKDCPDDFVIACNSSESYAYRYAEANGISCSIVCRHLFADYVSNNDATCVTDGTTTAYCEKGCGASDTIADPGSATGIHIYGDWSMTKEPAYLTAGEEIRVCKSCDAFESRELDALTLEISVNNYVFTLNCAEDIRQLCYVPGIYNTANEVRNAEACTVLSESEISEHIENRCFAYEVPEAARYTLLVVMSDGAEYIFQPDMTRITPYVTGDGLTVTLHGLCDVKDFFIAKGEYHSYRDMKKGGYIFSAGALKIGDRHDYSYVVYEKGIHTVFIRYFDGSTAVFHTVLTADEPIFTGDGMLLTLSNLNDVKIIRTAYGKWNTASELKRADKICNYQTKVTDPFTITFGEEGVYTVIVEYHNGYKKVYHYQAKRSVPCCEVNGNIVTFKLTSGVYTFCTEYPDGSYRLFAVNIE